MAILIELDECNIWNQLSLSESHMTMIMSVPQGIFNQYLIDKHLKDYNDMIQVQNGQTIIFSGAHYEQWISTGPVPFISSN